MLEELKSSQNRYHVHKQSHGLVLGACLYACALTGVFQLRIHPAQVTASHSGIEMEYESNTDGQAGRFVANLYERARGNRFRVNMADDPEAACSVAVVSPDRLRIAYTRYSIPQDGLDDEQGLCVADVSPRAHGRSAWARQPRLLVPLEVRTLCSVTFCWLPDSRHVVFSARDWRRERRPATLQADLWLLDTEDGGVRPLTRTPHLSEYTPSASPDGKWIAFTRQTTTQFLTRRDVFVTSMDGSQVLRVTTPGNSPGTVQVFPRWSADGRFITFSSQGCRYRIPSDGSASAVWVSES